MDLYVALSLTVWAVGGVFSTALLFWLDRDRLELPFVFKASSLVAWPLMLPYLLHQREDLSPWEAGRNALLWVVVLSPGPALDLARYFEPAPAPSAVVNLRPPEPAPRVSVAVLPEPNRTPGENDKREAVRYWNSGIIFYQKGDYERARDEWQRCSQLDVTNSDCVTGLQRIDQTYGSTLVSAVR
jgi:hypothetical protein